MMGQSRCVPKYKLRLLGCGLLKPPLQLITTSAATLCCIERRSAFRAGDKLEEVDATTSAKTAVLSKSLKNFAAPR
jgi:hypothetical protein